MCFDLIFVRGKLNPANSSGLNFRKYFPLNLKQLVETACAVVWKTVEINWSLLKPLILMQFESSMRFHSFFSERLVGAPVNICYSYMTGA